MSGAAAPAALVSATDITPRQWSALAGQRVLFGHQSVGENILAGVTEVLTQSGSPVRVREGASAGSEPGLLHVRVGRNGDPASKMADFAARVNEARPSIAAMKFCYVDVNGATDPEALFASYREAAAGLKAAHPEMTLVHVTLPLTADRGTLFHWRTVLRGNGERSDRRVNRLRQRYNELLRAEYAGREPVFDLAAIESTGADGRPVTVRFDGADVPVLAREWTYDGGHLNEAGRHRAAEGFLALLASL